MANGWPQSQHGYATGRGVHTAWRAILKVSDSAKSIVETDFVGYFNNIKLECVAMNLNKFLVPKFMIIHLINLSASDIQNEDREMIKKHLDESDM